MRQRGREGVGLFKKAASMFGAIGMEVGEPSCLRKLGELAFGDAKYLSAQAAYEEALTIYQHGATFTAKRIASAISGTRASAV